MNDDYRAMVAATLRLAALEAEGRVGSLDWRSIMGDVAKTWHRLTERQRAVLNALPDALSELLQPGESR